MKKARVESTTECMKEGILVKAMSTVISQSRIKKGRMHVV